MSNEDSVPDHAEAAPDRPEPWNMKALRDHVRRTATDELARELLRSIGRSIDIFHYHLCNARDALDGLVGLEGHERDLMFVLGAADKQEEFEQARIVSEANLLGAFYATCNMLESFAQLVNVLALQSQLSIDQCSLRRVTKALPASALRDRLQTLVASPWYSYVVDFVNTAKHRHLVPHPMNVSFVEERSGMQVGAFQYEDRVTKDLRSHPPYWIRDVLAGCLEVKNSIVGLGSDLNALVLPAT